MNTKSKKFYDKLDPDFKKSGKEVAREKHNYRHFRNVPSSFQLLMMDEIADRYATAKAKASCEATLKRVL